MRPRDRRDTDLARLLRLGGGAELRAVVADRHRAVDRVRTGLELDARPAQREGLAAPAAGLGRDPQVCEEVRIARLGLGQDARRLVERGRYPLGCVARRPGTFMAALDSTYSMAATYDSTADSTVRTFRAVAGLRPCAS